MPESVSKVIEDVIENYKFPKKVEPKLNYKPFVCTSINCLKTFKTKGSLKNHKSLYHCSKSKIAIEGKFICPVCKAGFSLKCNMLKHVSAVHERNRYQCHVCDSNFAHNQDLEKHISRYGDSDILDATSKICYLEYYAIL